jgi:fluoroacetyl-CoA thioesterase
MDSIQPGMVVEREFVVDESLCTDHLGPVVGPVLATPQMSDCFERTCLEAVASLLPLGYGTVGSRIDVKHLAPTPIGFHLKIRAELVEVDGRKQTWRVEAFDDVEKVAECTHWRAIVNLDKIKARLEEKKARFGK